MPQNWNISSAIRSIFSGSIQTEKRASFGFGADFFTHWYENDVNGARLAVEP